MAGPAGADDLVLGSVGGAAGVSRRSADNAFDMLKDSLYSPEAAAGEDQRLLAALAGEGFIHSRSRQGNRLCRWRSATVSGPLTLSVIEKLQ